MNTQFVIEQARLVTALQELHLDRDMISALLASLEAKIVEPQGGGKYTEVIDAVLDDVEEPSSTPAPISKAERAPARNLVGSPDVVDESLDTESDGLNSVGDAFDAASEEAPTPRRSAKDDETRARLREEAAFEGEAQRNAAIQNHASDGERGDSSDDSFNPPPVRNLVHVTPLDVLEAREKAEKAKKNLKYVIVVNQEPGEITADSLGWILQIDEEMRVDEVIPALEKQVDNYASSKKAKKNPASSIGESFDIIPAKDFKEDGILIKTKNPVNLVFIPNGK